MKSHCIVQLKWVNFMLCKLYPSKDAFENGYPGKTQRQTKRTGFGFSFSFSSKTDQMPLHFWDPPRFCPRSPQCLQNNFSLHRWKTVQSSDAPQRLEQAICMFIQNTNVTGTKAKCLHVTPPLSMSSGRTVTGRVGSSQSLETQLLATSYVPGTVSGIGDTVVTETDMIPSLRRLVIPQLLLPCWNRP